MTSDMENLTEDNILVVKGRFKSAPLNLFGQFFIMMSNTKQIDKYDIVVTSYSDSYDMEPHTSWDQYEEYIADTKWKGQFNNSMTISLSNQLKSLADDTVMTEELYNQIYNYDYDKMEVILYDVINRIIHEKNLLLETSIQEVTPGELQKTKEERNKPKEEENEAAPKVENESIILQVKPILAPVKGKPIYELKLGDRIMIKIQENSDKARYFIDYFDLRQDGKIMPTAGEVIDIKAGKERKDPIEILTKIDKGIYGRILEDEKQVKLKIYDPNEDNKAVAPGKKVSSNSQSTSYDESEPSVSKSTIIMFVLFFLILFLFIGLLFLIW